MYKIIDYIYKNKEWIFSGIGLLIFSGIGFIIKSIRSNKQSKKKKHTMLQTNDHYSSGTQIGIQNNYYGKEDASDKSTD